MPAAGRKLSHASKYSCVAPGPPCSKSSLIRGLLPTRLVQTLNFPLGVWISIVLTPPLNTSARPALSKYAIGVIGSAARPERADATQAMAARRLRALLMSPRCADAAWRLSRRFIDFPGSWQEMGVAAGTGKNVSKRL